MTLYVVEFPPFMSVSEVATRSKQHQVEPMRSVISVILLSVYRPTYQTSFGEEASLLWCKNIDCSCAIVSCLSRDSSHYDYEFVDVQ